MTVTRWKSDPIGNSDDAAADGFENAGSPYGPDAPPFATAYAFGRANLEADLADTKGPKLTTIVDFMGVDGASPEGTLMTDAAGDLFGTTVVGGADDKGTVFEIAWTRQGYASAPTILASFAGYDGEQPAGGLIADGAGDIYGTATGGGTHGYGTAFELVKIGTGFAASPTTLVDFTGSDGADPYGGLIADAAGNLFGTTSGGVNQSVSTVFEIAKIRRSDAPAPTTLVTFDGSDGRLPTGRLIADAAGDLFGTTDLGGTDDDGVVFEIVKTNGVYANAPTTLVSFTGADGAEPGGGLITDAAGDLFGTTSAGGADHGGTVFEIAKTGGGYASAPTVLVSFTGPEGYQPDGSLIADAAGNLFGTTGLGGPGGANDGTVFEIAKTEDGYASRPTILVTLNGSNGANPVGSLIADAAGDLLGTTAGGAHGYGTVFEITHSGYVTRQQVSQAAPARADLAHSSAMVAAFVQVIAGATDRGEWSGLVGVQAIRESHQSNLATPRVAVA
jgi:hypothetical protein